MTLLLIILNVYNLNLVKSKWTVNNWMYLDEEEEKTILLSPTCPFSAIVILTGSTQHTTQLLWNDLIYFNRLNCDLDWVASHSVVCYCKKYITLLLNFCNISAPSYIVEKLIIIVWEIIYYGNHNYILCNNDSYSKKAYYLHQPNSNYVTSADSLKDYIFFQTDKKEENREKTF